MTTFDASTPGAGGYPSLGGYPPVDAPPIPNERRDPEPAEGFDAFEALREQLSERDEDAGRTTPIEVPGIGWRLICAVDFEYEQYKEWQKAALPKNQRNGRKLNPLDMNQATLAYLVLLNTCEGIEFQRKDGEWESLADGDGSATLKSSMLLTRMNVVDPRVLVRKMFGGDGRLIIAGQKVIAAAGYAGGDDDAQDPTG